MKKALKILLAALMVFALVGCSSNASTDDTNSGDNTAETTGNAAKPVVWFNRQPSNSTTGELDTAALNWNEDTYYVGFDANQGAELQGTMIVDYIKAHADTIDRNGDGVIGYVLCIGDVGHNDSIARTRGVRKALGTAVTDSNGDIIADSLESNSSAVQEGSIEVNGTTYKIVELASKEMKNTAGATWDAATAGDAFTAWEGTYGDQIDIVASNNDGMAMAIFNKMTGTIIPTFGYDANSDAVAAIANGYGGTISQHADVQAYLTLRVLRNALDGVDVNTGISVADEAGNVLEEGVDYVYNAEERSFYALNLAVTAENYEDYLDATVTYAPVSNQISGDEYKVWLDIYNASDNFLSATYQPLLEKYDDLLNLKVEYIGGDGQTESNITNRLANPSEYDGFCINMVKTDNSASYTSLLAD